MHPQNLSQGPISVGNRWGCESKWTFNKQNLMRVLVVTGILKLLNGRREAAKLLRDPLK